MRMFLLIFLLFLPLNVNAACSNHDNNANACKNAAGCYYHVNSNECIDCPANSNADATGYYCPENGICDDETVSSDGKCECPTPFNLSTQGTTNIGDCYTPCVATSDNYNDVTKNCGLTYLGYYNANEVSCKNNNGTITYDSHEENYHAEPLSNNTYGCYLNTRPCNLFSAQDSVGSNINTQNDITGNATWNNSYYTTNNCQYKTSVTNFENRSCTASVTYKPNATLTSATGTLVFSQLVSYYCTECTYDYFCPDPDTDYTSCTAYNNVKICSCKKIPRGNYQTVDWSAGTPPYNTYTACPIGQTTFNIYAGEYVGGESIDDCQYGDQTQLCDTGGCRNLGDLDTPENWTNLP